MCTVTCLGDRGLGMAAAMRHLVVALMLACASGRAVLDGSLCVQLPEAPGLRVKTAGEDLLLRELMRRRVVVDGGVAMDNVDDGFSRPAADRWTTSARCPSSSSTIALSVVEDGEVGAFVTSCGIVLGAGHESFVLCRPECELCQSTRSCLDRSVRASTACMHTFGSTCSWSLAHKGPLAQYPRYQWLVFCALLVCGWHMRGTTTGTQPLLVHHNSAMPPIECRRRTCSASGQD